MSEQALTPLDSYSPVEQLDYVLEILIDRSIFFKCLTSFQIADNLGRSKRISANPLEIEFILYKLIEDGYVSNDKGFLKNISINKIPIENIEESLFFLTFDGKVFIKDGGYLSQARRRVVSEGQMQWAQKQAGINTKWIRDATVVASIAGIVAAVISICAALISLKYLNWDIQKFHMEHPQLYHIFLGK